MSLIPSQIGSLQEPAHHDLLFLNDQITDRQVYVWKSSSHNRTQLRERNTEPFISKVDRSRREMLACTRKHILLIIIQVSSMPGAFVPLVRHLSIPGSFKILVHQSFALIC